MKEFLGNLGLGDSIQEIISSLLLIAGVMISRFFLTRAVLAWKGPAPETRRKWLVNVRNGTIFLLLLGLILIWAQELRTFALSLVAVAAAIAVAMKELFLCISGAVMRASAQPFEIGDRVEIGGYRGDVIDHNIWTTTLMELGPAKEIHKHTGRTIVIPNALLLSSSILNETFLGDFVLHVFRIPLRFTDDWQKAEELLLAAANQECGVYLKEARAHMEEVMRKRGLKAPSVEPRIWLHVPEPGTLHLVIRVPAPARHKGDVEQAILRRFLLSWSRSEARS